LAWSTAPVEIYAPIYAGTVQEVALDLLARKVTVSTQMDGLDIESGLEAAGAGAADAVGLTQAAALGIGAAIYDILAGAAAIGPRRVPVPAPPAPPGAALETTPAPPSAAEPAARPPADTGRYRQAALFDLGADAA
jgi:hypothetical protein